MGIGLPGLEDVDPDDILSQIGDYQVTMVLPTDPQMVSASLPRYLTSPCNLASYFDTLSEQTPFEVEAKLFDFGTGAFLYSLLLGEALTDESRISAHSPGAPLSSFQCAIEAVSPETAWARVMESVESPPIERPADVWALGSLVSPFIPNQPSLSFSQFFKGP